MTVFDGIHPVPGCIGPYPHSFKGNARDRRKAKRALLRRHGHIPVYYALTEDFAAEEMTLNAGVYLRAGFDIYVDGILGCSGTIYDGKARPGEPMRLSWHMP